MQADVPAVAGIYDRILLKEEAGQVTIGWLRGVYPTEQTARAALAADDLFVMEADGVICATARINQVQVPEYRNADWRYADVPENEIMVLHTLVVDPLMRGRHGYGKAFVSFYEQYAKEHDCRVSSHGHERHQQGRAPVLREARLLGVRHRRLHVQRHSGCEAGVPGERSSIFELGNVLIFAV